MQKAVCPPHWQVHIPGEAFVTSTNLPPLVCSTSIGWRGWAHAPNPCTDFANAIGAFVHKVVEGGLVVLDHKHIAMNDGQHGWFSHVNEAFVHLPGGSLLANKGVVEWMSPDLYGEYHTHMATVYEVHHGIDGALPEGLGASHAGVDLDGHARSVDGTGFGEGPA